MNKLKIVGTVALWLVTLLLALICLRSGLMKLPGFSGEQFWIRDFQRWGYPDWFRLVVAAAELTSCALLLFPRIAAVGASIFVLVMLGAIFTHFTNNETGRLPFNFVLLVLSLIVAWSRLPRFAANFRKVHV